MTDTTSRLVAAARMLSIRLRDDAAEGVISTAIAVLILAFVGAGMWIGFSAMMDSSCDAAAEQLDSSIGDGGSTAISC